MYLLSMEESDNKLNPRSTTTQPNLLPLLARVAGHRLLCMCAICARNPRIACAKLRFKLCTTKSADGANPHFAHNIQYMPKISSHYGTVVRSHRRKITVLIRSSYTATTPYRCHSMHRTP